MRMRKRLGIIYIVICIVICLIPFAGMTVFATDSTTENKTLASFPEFISDGKINLNFASELGEYFEDHFAFRQALVNADAIIQSKIFGVSNVDTIITGDDGWLYYSATLDDYLGQNLMSERSIYNAAHNLSITQKYVEANNAQFAVTVAPNKNSLYGEHMPYYDAKIVSNEKNIENFTAELENQGVAYIDLFSAFENEDEVLYLMRDSHWNEKGAVLAYNEILGSMDIEHDMLETVTAVRTKTEIGDLNLMIYPLTAEPEWNYDYKYEQTYTYLTDTDSVEDIWIITENPDGKGSLLMFRDSFGNTLLPLMANTFSEGYFSQGVPYAIGSYMEVYSPETVIIEKVERNIDQFAADPPLLQNIESEIDTNVVFEEDAASLVIEESFNNTDYWCISGVIDEGVADTRTNIYIRMTSGDTVKTFEAFLISDDGTDYGYKVYISKDYVTDKFPDTDDEILIEVITQMNGELKTVHMETAVFPENYTE